jgi:ADP-ribose pyrophosphatase YjhB (NUDIX family)
VRFGETLHSALKREFAEEYGMVVAPHELLCVTDHLLQADHQHWVSPSYLATHVSGEPRIMEPAKCSAIGWFDITSTPEPLMTVSRNCLREYLSKYGDRPFWREPLGA